MRWQSICELRIESRWKRASSMVSMSGYIVGEVNERDKSGHFQIYHLDKQSSWIGIDRKLQQLEINYWEIHHGNK